MKPVVIIGTGLAGYTVVREFRKLDKQTPVTMISMDDGAFYSKPMLSNAIAKGKDAAGLISTPVESIAKQLDARIMSYTEVTAVDTERRSVILQDRELHYGKLVLAWGAEPIHPSLGGEGAREVLSVNSRLDYAVFRECLDAKHRVAIIGAGLIGCEFANDLSSARYRVDLIDLAEWPLGRLLPEQVGRALEHALAELGIRWHLGQTVESVDKSGEGYLLKLGNEETLSADIVLGAVGLRPRTGIAAEAGLHIRRGIVVDAYLQSSVQGIFALGDCAEVEGHVMPYVMPIMQAARALAKTLSGVATKVIYPAMPVIVKTPVLPTLVLPPPMGVQGEWLVTGEEKDLEAEYIDAEGRLRGFSLMGKAVAKKQALVKRVPPLIGESGG